MFIEILVLSLLYVILGLGYYIHTVHLELREARAAFQRVNQRIDIIVQIINNDGERIMQILDLVDNVIEQQF